jgi:DNA repair exonuclease SbcCD ATPase subunit
MFCLYDKTPRAFKGDHIMNNRKDEFECQLIFEINDETYGIKRVGSRKKTGVVKVDVEFWKKGGDGEVISLNGEDRRNTNANIRNYVGTYEDFIMTTLSSQSANSIFIDKSNSERKDLLMQFMGLNIFDKLYDIANDESKEIAGVLKRFKKMDVTEELVTINDSLKNTRQELEVVEGQYEEIKNIKIEQDKKIETLLSNKRIVPPSSQSIDILENELSRAQELLAEDTNKLDKANADFDNLTQTLQSLESDYAKYDIQRLLASVEQHRITNSEVENLKQLVKVASTKLTEKNKFKEKLSGYKYNPNCDVCVENNKNIIEDLEAANRDIEDLTTYISVKNDLKEAALISLQDLQEDVSTYNLTLKFKEDIDNLKNTRLPRLTNDIKSIALKIDDIKKNIGNIKENINIYHQNKEAILHNQQIDNEIKEIQIVINTEEAKLNTAQKTIRDLHGNVSVLEAKQQDLRSKLLEAEKLEETHEAYNQYALAIGRDGIPYEMVKKITPNIETEVNNILSQIVDFNITLEVDGKNINGKLVYDYDRTWPLENSSGMERFISSIAIRVALMNVSNLPKPNFLIIDEGFGVLDAEHLSSMQTLFNLLKTHFDFILIVSHLDTARDMVDNIIEIKREDGYSQISA